MQFGQIVSGSKVLAVSVEASASSFRDATCKAPEVQDACMIYSYKLTNHDAPILIYWNGDLKEAVTKTV